MDIKLVEVTEQNFDDVIKLKSDENQEKYFKSMKDGWGQMRIF